MALMIGYVLPLPSSNKANLKARQEKMTLLGFRLSRLLIFQEIANQGPIL